MTRLLVFVDAPPVAVVRAGGQFSLIATEALLADALVFVIDGDERAEPDQWSVQVGARRHMAVPAGVDLAAQLDRYPWRFMNHSCAPNTRIDGREVRTIRPIEAGEQLTFDYDTTEWQMAAPFECRCGSPHCRGLIRGYRHLPPLERRRLDPIAAPYLPR